MLAQIATAAWGRQHRQVFRALSDRDARDSTAITAGGLERRAETGKTVSGLRGEELERKWEVGQGAFVCTGLVCMLTTVKNKLLVCSNPV